MPSDTAAEEDSKVPKKKALGQVLFNASHSDYEVVADVAETRGWKLVKSEEQALKCNVHWIDDSAIGDWMRKVEPWMRINHFPGMNNSLARKTRLARNMGRMQRLFPAEYRFIPPTWVLPDDLGDLERKFGPETESKVFYIVKPDHLCQGRGIFLTTELERLRQVAADSRKKDEATVVQRYIMRPMLIDGLKFDLRLYFLVAGKKASDGNIDLRCFLFRDGLVRLCTTAYEAPTSETMNQKCMHLTNYAVNKNSKDFVQNRSSNSAEDDGQGSKRSLRWFLSWVEQTFGEKERRKLWVKLMGLCVKTVLTVSPTLEAEYDGAFPRDLTGGQMGCRCFEVLGIDVMLDSKRKPYLIEVNHLPSFTCDSPLDDDIKRRLVTQTLDLTCENLTGKDKKLYEQLVKERRDGTAASKNEADVQSLMDLTSYKDFERAYPPPPGAPKLAAQLEAIRARVQELFKPVHTMKKRAEEPPAAARPPLPPRSTASAPGKGCPDGNEPSRRPAASTDARTTRPPETSRQRSGSAPGPPRCGLPPINKWPSSRGRTTAQGVEAEEVCTKPVRSASAKPQRVFLQLKSAQILL